MDRVTLPLRRPPPQEPSVVIGEYCRLDEIGKGSFAMVYRGIHVTKRAYVAIKSVNITKLSKKLRDNLEEEVNILKNLHHPHIVALFSCRESRTQMHLIMEYCELGDLSTFIRKRSSLGEADVTKDMIRKYPCPSIGGLNEVVTRHFAKQIASALQFMRAQHLLHRDIKPQNLLLVPPPAWTEKNSSTRILLMIDEQQEGSPAGIASLPMLKIADFGFARHLPSLALAETLCGSPLYMAPEILRYEKYDAKADLWSVGTVLHEMTVGKPPFRASNHVELLRKIEKNDDRIRFPGGVVISSAVKRLIRALLKRTPTERISYADFFEDPVLNEEIPGLAPEDRQSPANPDNVPSALEGVKKDAALPEPQSTGSVVSRRGSRPAEDIAESSGTRTATRPLSTAEASRPPALGNAEPARPSSNPSSEVPIVKSRDHRPTLTSATTAPARPLPLPTPAAVAIVDRGNRRATITSGSSVPRENRYRERGARDGRDVEEEQERAAEDVAFERDYVVVEKRSVEANALADAIAHSPHVQRQTQYGAGAMVRRATTSGTPLSSTAPQSTSPLALQIAGRQAPTSHQRVGSYERRYGPTPAMGSATSAISKALNMASLRVFGMGFSPPLGKGPSPPTGYPAFPAYPVARSSLLMDGGGARPSDARNQNSRTIMHLHDLADRSNAVWGFANVKYSQLVPLTPANTEGLGIDGTGQGPEEAEGGEDDGLTPTMTVEICEEAIVLYCKTLAILQNMLDLAGAWWGQRHGAEEFAPRSAPVKSSSQDDPADIINWVVQWARDKYNDSLEKSEFAALRLVSAQKLLPTDHPGHPSNHSTMFAHSALMIGASTEKFRLTTGISAEKLMYERACEMSRSAAINELTNSEPESGLLLYTTAILMLKAMLDDGRHGLNRRTLKADPIDDDDVPEISVEDQDTVKELLVQCKSRRRALKEKIELKKAARRYSTSRPTGQPPSARVSPAATPRLSDTPPR